MNAGLQLGFLENFDFAAFDVGRVIDAQRLERIIGPGLQDAIFEPGEITGIQEGGRRDNDHYGQFQDGLRAHEVS
jgi:hypothetical protein